MEGGKNIYSKGCWAPSLKYHNGKFYATFSSLDLGKTFVCTRSAPMDFGGWDFTEIKGIGYAHDADLFFDTDGRVYLVNGGCTITELNADCKAVKAGGINKKIFDRGSSHDVNRIFEKIMWIA
ncbi:family 43 glycosylhydrolase [Clostridium estertheticum]|uniref:family 43 glycosylhydrolase n=1 Tax=Clostridium estertheticum TaxID=238834 RepID=UPI00217E1355|nr:family 43 glycosylhydrolase [Clostridium estertheticum]